MLLKHLHRNDLTQVEFAELMDVRPQTVNRWVKDQAVMDYENAYNASVILKCSMEELYEHRSRR
nr:helix-turn-helix transcriptional regulator [Robertmurraya korlensis]